MTRNKDQYLAEIWNQVLEYLQTNCNIEPPIIDSFYKMCSIQDLTETKAIIVAPSIIFKQIVQQEYQNIGYAFADVLGTEIPPSVDIYAKNELKNHLPVEDEEDLQEEDLREFQSMPIQRDRTFKNFVVGDCNRESQSAALACAAKPGQFFNPLFIYGNSGLGKTHLLMAIANYVLTNDPSKKVYYTESFITSIFF